MPEDREKLPIRQESTKTKTKSVEKEEKKKVGVEKKTSPPAEKAQEEAKHVVEEIQALVKEIDEETENGVTPEEKLKHRVKRVIELSAEVSRNKALAAHYLLESGPITEELIQNNAKAALILLDMMAAPSESHDNPTWLMARGMELQKSVNYQTQLELHPYLSAIATRINEICELDDQRKQLLVSLEEIEEETETNLSKIKILLNEEEVGKEAFIKELQRRINDELLIHLGQLPPPEEDAAWFYNPADPEDRIEEPLVREIIEKFTRRLEDRPEITIDHHRLNEFYKALEQEIEKRLESDQRGRADRRRIIDEGRYHQEAKRFKEKVLNDKLRPLEALMDKQREPKEYAKRHEKESEAVAECEGRLIRRDEVGAYGTGNFAFTKFFSAEAVKHLKKGTEGEKAFFNDFIRKQEMMLRDPFHLDITEVYEIGEFWSYLYWRYGPEGGRTREQIWKDELTRRKQFHWQMLQLMHVVGDPRDMLKVLGQTRPEELQYLTREGFCQYTIGMIEDETKLMLEEKMTRWQELDKKAAKEERLMKIHDYEKRMREGEELTAEERADYGRARDDQKAWEQGVWLTDEDVQGKFERFKEATEKKDRALERIRRGEGKGDWEDEYRRLVRMTVEELEQMSPDDLREHGERRRELEKLLIESEDRHYLSDEDKEWLNREYTSNLEWRVREKLIRFLDKNNIAYEDWEIDKALSLGMKFNIITARLPLMLCNLYVEPKTGAEKMRSPPFEDLVRILNPEAFFFRFSSGGKLGEISRALYHSNILYERAKDAKITETKEWKNLPPSGDPIIEEQRKRLKVIEQQLGIPWTELLRGGFAQIGGPFDNSGWRGEIGVIDEVIKKYSEVGKDHRQFALGLQLTLAGGEAALEAQGMALREVEARGLTGAKRDKEFERLKEKYAKELTTKKKIEIFERIIKRQPLLLTQLMVTEKNQLLARHPNVNWEKLKSALQFVQMEMTTKRKDTVTLQDGREIKVNFNDQGFFEEFVGKYLDLQEGENIGSYYSFVKELQNAAEAKKENLALYPYAMTLTLSDIPWTDTEWYGLGKIALERRLARDIAGAADFRQDIAEIWFNPSPMEWQKLAEKIHEAKQHFINYADITSAEKKARLLTRFALQFNENQRRRVINWIPGLENIFRNLSASNPEARKLLETYSYSILFYGPDGNAWDENDISTFIAYLRRMGTFTEHPEYADEMMRQFKTTAPWRTLAFVRGAWFPLFLLVVGQALSKTFKGEEEEE